MTRTAKLLAYLKGQQSAGPDETEFRKALKDFLDSVGVPTRTLHQTYTLVRLRQNLGGKRFTTVAELSYRPFHLKAASARASTASRSLFYAASCERRNLAKGAFTDIPHGLKVALFETIPFLRDNCKRSRGSLTIEDFSPNFRVARAEEFPPTCVTYALWEATTNINLANICLHSMQDEDWGDNYLRDYMFGRYVLENPIQRVGEDEFWNYLAQEFSRPGNDQNKLGYFVSSIAAEVLYDWGFDGVCYPSVRCNGLGMNVALKPEAVDSKLICTHVGLCNVSAVQKELVLDVPKSLRLEPGATRFDLYA